MWNKPQSWAESQQIKVSINLRQYADDSIIQLSGGHMCNNKVNTLYANNIVAAKISLCSRRFTFPHNSLIWEKKPNDGDDSLFPPFNKWHFRPKLILLKKFGLKNDEISLKFLDSASLQFRFEQK